MTAGPIRMYFIRDRVIIKLNVLLKTRAQSAIATINFLAVGIKVSLK